MSRVIGVAVFVAFVFVACVTSDADSRPLPPAPAELDVRMTEYRFEHVPTIPPGRVVVEARNEGRERHSVTLARLPEDVPPILEQLRGESRRSVETVAQVMDRPPGTRAAFAVDLAPGRYALLCFVRFPDGTTHAFQGMATEFRVAA